jgi:hypothetical protein
MHVSKKKETQLYVSLSRYRHADFKEEREYSSFSLFTSALEGMSGQRHARGAL